MIKYVLNKIYLIVLIYDDTIETGGMQMREDINKILDNMTLFDDDLMSRVFDKNIDATELILRIILKVLM